MSDLRIIHRTSQESASSSVLVWQTCHRQILFLKTNESSHFFLDAGDREFCGIEAEVFLIEVLCGLHSPLLGETEVFGQFKEWWNQLTESTWKQQYQPQFEKIFAAVKDIRQKHLCGMGSQSYGSILRRLLPEMAPIEILGAGHLVREMLPWLQPRSSVRIWCRDPMRVRATFSSATLHDLEASDHLREVVVVAAPVSDEWLNLWLQARGFSKNHILFDFRKGSESFIPFVEPRQMLNLNELANQWGSHRQQINLRAEAAFSQIQNWRRQREGRAHLRPYGWEDL